MTSSDVSVEHILCEITLREWVMSRIWTSHVTYMNGTFTFHSYCNSMYTIFYVKPYSVWNHPMWMSHVTYINQFHIHNSVESPYAELTLCELTLCEWAMTCIHKHACIYMLSYGSLFMWVGIVIFTNESCHKWVMSQISHVTNESCHVWNKILFSHATSLPMRVHCFHMDQPLCGG